ncbi:transcriptional regulator, TetR family [Granulicella pectinivorans]|jgi:AcrR family transcriptional regulator|uniref:Transcriptional regulator, TetR family n=1 Tax=Granulicella pectinivorans TaxID=474950 RepID=A0A1I6LQ66_9BACT|nr:TetR/AcrR family transcriptional regulator [Granulicella pectinivorans]SFS05624.1 transcriptional regulator, TetR family [Granulicella pectinivorans]
MARARSPEKRTAILEAAIAEIADVGLSATTARIAERAGIATGTLFTYFPNKEDLLNVLYLELKEEALTRINQAYPQTASLEARARHVWRAYLSWWIESPSRRMVSVYLNLSNLITPKTRKRTIQSRTVIEKMLSDLEARNGLKEMPAGYAASLMSAMQEATMDFIAKDPRHREALIENGFQIFWRAVR